ncbi:MAG TPA: bifunctional DNA-formamidopyrimidine glycosylase/DNA-(apurinic or apyrimidinic site) lyase [Gammaproteobacteria bacterium]|nr:bifunctional DNA-formamidopyrimidine glycosylase/DNA-(apurinic or apyrimidinic site) lyase [Gammaproteobacteria bacterium]
MPELPEVETTCRGIAPHVSGQRIERVLLRETRLRWPVSPEVADLAGSSIVGVSRRAKYLLMALDRGSLIWHLGMSGSMRVLPTGSPAARHEHIELQLGNGLSLKFRDPRRFGALLYCVDDPLQHRLLQPLGPEPFADEFDADYLYGRCRGRSASIKTFIMNSHIVVGVGNIYASEALYLAGIRPTRAAGGISKVRIARLVAAIRATLTAAIAKGGTTLQDFTQADGKPGYFRHALQVYANKGDCQACGTAIRHLVQGQRSSYYCPGCQT